MLNTHFFKQSFSFCIIIFFARNIFSNENNNTKNSDFIEDITINEVSSSEQKFDNIDFSNFYKPKVENHFLSIGETVASNALIWTFNKVILKSPFSNISLDTIRHNITTPWVWDQDEFYVNHLLHPYQGSLYYISSRSNNLPVWESMLITSLGSLSWEIIAENELPSYNDLITTTIGAMPLGEILHRLYYTTNKIAGFFISPIDGINNLIMSKKINKPIGNLESISSKIIIGTLNSDILFKTSNKKENENYLPIYGGAELDIVYGNPYNLKTLVPYEHFDLNLKLTMSKHYYNFSLFTDGNLISFVPFETENCKTTMGLFLHYDFLLSTLTNFTKNALSLTTKQKITLPHNWNIKWALHLNWDMLSGSDFYYLFSEFEPTFTLGILNRIYDLGYGAGIKSSFSISNPLAGQLNLFINFDWLNTIKTSLPDKGSTGYYFIIIGATSYEHKIYKSLSLGIEYDIYIKDAYYDSVESTFENKQILNTYIKYYFK